MTDRRYHEGIARNRHYRLRKGRGDVLCVETTALNDLIINYQRENNKILIDFNIKYQILLE